MTRARQKTERVLAEIDRDPARLGYEIAEAAGCTKSFVSQVARRHRRVFGRSRGEAVCAALSPENWEWAASEAAKNNINIAEFVDACITDARLDHAIQEIAK